MAFLQKMLQNLSWLSLDVVVGAMAGMYFFMELFHASLQWPAYALLALAVWSIYTLDHLIDVRNLPHTLAPRRVFHKKLQKTLWILLGVATIGGAVGAFAWFGWGKELQLTIILALLIVGSRVMIRKNGPGWMKEFSIAVFYVVGIVWLPLLRAESVDITWVSLLFLPGYMLLAFLNLLMLSFLDRDEDMKSGFFSVASTMPTLKIIQLIRQLSFGLIFLSLGAFILLPSFYRPFSCVVLLMALVHYLTFFQNGLAVHQKRQRMELAFWIPWVLFLL
ncbi:hypothetical protein [Algoriphagus sp. AK58]|uniref:hypothetical protein n=1 Tax=Algoriphagus sp. AK58 TaxID=1406877 RepID=UPI0016501018|nr:hypothetical protein [Algoriphagus sp. AK58]MBC6366359.1 hypothetical protein [Algoriphagus sp. AK58]